MSRLKRAEAVLGAAEQWCERCLLGRGSIFWKGEELWTLKTFHRLSECLPDDASGGDGKAIRAWLDAESTDVKRLAAEVRWLDYLSEPGVTYGRKIDALRDMWKWLNEPFPEGDNLLTEAVLAGEVHTNMKSQRVPEYLFLCDRMRNWYSRSTAQRRKLIEDPWEFSRWIHDGKHAPNRQLPHVLCYLLFPEFFEPIGVIKTKRQIAQGLRQHLGMQIQKSTGKRAGVERPGGRITGQVWSIADLMPGATRQEVITACVQQGINPNTASTQYYHWKADQGGWAGGPIAVDVALLDLRERLKEKYPDEEIDLLSDPWKGVWQEPLQEPKLLKPPKVDYEAWYREEFGDTQVWLLAAGRGGSRWSDFIRNQIVSVGWDIGDLRRHVSWDARFEALVATGKYPSRRPTQTASMLGYFLLDMKVGDTIIARRGTTAILGVGKITGDYVYDESRAGHRHTRTVEWTPCKPAVSIPVKLRGVPRKTLTPYRPYKDWLHDIFNLLGGVPPGVGMLPDYTPEHALADLFIGEERFHLILNALESRKNLILQGPPGTGKTFMARRLAWCLIGRKDSRSIEMVQFHQSYAYEDFVQGYRPTETGGFSLRNGVFYEFCERARKDEDKPYVFIIDEINRGNMSRIMGELLMLIEADKRSSEYAASLTYGKPGHRFFVPPNVYILGMMNTADRSLAIVDYALRRRFAFEGLVPAFSSPNFRQCLLDNEVDQEVVRWIQDRMTTLNEKIREDSELGAGFEIGHSYFVPQGPEEVTDGWYEEIVDTHIAPLLREYWYDNPRKAEHAIKDLLA